MPPIKFAFAAHVDHGKSTICGHLLYKSGYVTEHEMEELKKKAEANKMKGWNYAYVLDILEEERQSGKTMDYNPIEFDYQGDHYCLVDNAGHQHLVRTLIAGLNYHQPKETIGCLVVSLDTGEYEAGMKGGQTKESAKLLRGSGIEHLVILLNKIDLVGVDTARYQLVKEGIEKYIAKLGFKTVNVLPVSGYRGDNLTEMLDLLKKISEEHIWCKLGAKEPEYEPSNKMNFPSVQIKIHHEEDFTKLITAGFQCILHCGRHEYQITFEKLCHYDLKADKLVNKGVIAKNGDVIVAKLKCDETEKFVWDGCERVILRQDNHTIAFGKLYSKK
jgi:translation elongation factor EF-1alpha